MRRHLAALAVVAGVLTPAAAVSATPFSAAADGQLGIRLLDAPTDRRDDPRARIYIVDHVHGGDVVSRHIAVSNTTAGSMQVETYAAGASVSGGAFVFADGRTGNELSSWTAVTPSPLVVPAGGQADARVTITVPRDATDGERYGVVWAQATSTGAGNVHTVSRVGIRIYLSVGEGKEPRSSFTVDTLQAERRPDGVPVVLARVHNTGARALDMRGTLQLRSADGLSAGPYDATLGTTLAPGESEPVRIVVPKVVNGGPWTATLTLSSGQLQRRVQGVITFPDTAGTASVPVRATDVPLYKNRSLVGIVAAVLIGLLSLALLAIGLLALLRRRQEQEQTRGSVVSGA
ncbi:MAG: hypothetical protein JWM02_1022 [Frankiales bacterium]|nr:hypothetical protein [Frankiales bacterium]